MSQSLSPSRLSRRRFLRLAGQSAAAAAVLTGCATVPNAPLFVMPTRPAPPPTPTPIPTATPVPAPTPTPTPLPLASLDEMIGQMMLVGFRGSVIDDDHPIAHDIRERYLGGVVLFDYDVPSGAASRNIQSPAQVKELVSSLQSLSPTPLLVSVDHEGGFVTRLKEAYGFPPTFSHAYLGANGDLNFTRQQATAMAKTLAGLGINLNLAPVVDVNTNPDNPIIGRFERSFSSDPDVVIEHALAFIQAHHDQHVLCTLKHFPGHGSSSSDSHLGLVDVTESWSRDELKPFAAIIQAGMADLIMTAHVFNAHLDPDLPATLSKAVVTGLLRGKLGYNGVVISDDMQMGAITEHYGFEEAILDAVEAGVDVLAISNNSLYEEGAAARAIAAIKQAVEAGRIPVSRIEQSYARILQVKSRLPAA